MTPKQAQDQIKRLKIALTDPKNIRKALTLAATSSLSEMDKRIFVQGKKADETPIGTYSTKPIYVNPVRDAVISPRKRLTLAPRGKQGSTKPFKSSGNPRKTVYFSDGYKQLRLNKGLDLFKVNLEYGSTMRQNIAVIPESDFVVSVQFKDEQQAKKKSGNEKRFGGAVGTIFRLSKKEQAKATEIFAFEMNKRFRKETAA